MGQSLKTIFICILSQLLLQTVSANNVAISNPTLTGQNTMSQFTLVQFDITWDNAWRDTENWDAVWVFVKYSVNGGPWSHATLGDFGHTAPVGSTIDTPGDSKGVFIYRNAIGSGTNTWIGVQLKWEYGLDGVADNAYVQFKVLAIEMAYVPTAEFAAGSGGTSSNEFTLTTINTANATVEPFGSGSLGGQGGGFPTGQMDPSSPSWPNGYRAFYSMKYEITQEQYVDFLNCLTYDQQDARTAYRPNSTVGTWALGMSSNRNGIAIQTTGVESSISAVYANNLDGDNVFNESVDGQNIACNYLNWMDGCAYADWAGLRPMTELEFEKTCRGNQTPVADEYAWGTTDIAGSAYTLENLGTENEGISSNYLTTLGTGNCNYYYTNGVIHGPFRVGIFAANANNITDQRVRSGASFYGVMEMSGNLMEPTVTIGNLEGRYFTGTHGDGILSTNGSATNSDWPGFANGEVTNSQGSGSRGGSFNAPNYYIRISARNYAMMAIMNRNYYIGFRCVRPAP